jgi:hypothetical protein
VLLYMGLKLGLSRHGWRTFQKRLERRNWGHQNINVTELGWLWLNKHREHKGDEKLRNSHTILIIKTQVDQLRDQGIEMWTAFVMLRIGWYGQSVLWSLGRMCLVQYFSWLGRRKAAKSFESLVSYHIITWRQNTEDHHRENLRFGVLWSVKITDNWNPNLSQVKIRFTSFIKVYY